MSSWSDISPAAGFLGASAHSDVRILRSRRGWQPLGLARLWRYRELLGFLALRDIQVRYKQTALGTLWAVLQPLAMMVALVGLRRIMRHGTGESSGSEVVFVFAAVLPWTFFAASVNAAAGSVVANAHMLRKIYFPRLIMPLAAVGAPLMDYAVSFAVLLALMVFFAVAPTWQLLLLPLLVATTLIAALGVGVLLAALTVSYRDFRYVVALLIQIWFFASPVIYSLDEVPARYQWLMWLNPMGGTIEAFRAAVTGSAVPWLAWAASTQVSILCLMAGLIYFGRAERKFADVV